MAERMAAVRPASFGSGDGEPSPAASGGVKNRAQRPKNNGVSCRRVMGASAVTESRAKQAVLPGGRGCRRHHPNVQTPGRDRMRKKTFFPSKLGSWWIYLGEGNRN